MYGFPATHLREEQTADLKLLADALFAQGVNQVFYHGMPYNKIGSDSVEFFATVYVGKNGSLTDELADFNAYMSKVCDYMRQGKTHSQVAVYIPLEDKIMAGPYPPERQRVWVWGKYEMRYIFTPDELEGYHPLWINRTFLEDATYENGQLISGDQQFEALYIDVQYMDLRALEAIVELAQQGLPIYLKQSLQQPNHVKSERYDTLLAVLQAIPSVTSDLAEVLSGQPLFAGEDLPQYWCRNVQDTLYCFFAQPGTEEVKYPMVSGESFQDQPTTYELAVNYKGKSFSMTLEMAPYQSLLYKIFPDGTYKQVDISFMPKDPVIKEPTKQRMHF